MKITYIYHSGFAIEGDGFTILIDYYKDTDTPSPEGWTNYVHDVLLKKPGRFYILASHFHPDHFNPEILTWKEERPDIIYILSKDILRHRRAPREATEHWLVKGDEYKDNLLYIKAYGSTDVGISFYFEIEGKRLFHAGDLNNWHWMDESTPAEWHAAEMAFLKERNDISREESEVDVAFFPVDARLGKAYMRGPEQFVQKIKTGLFIPMHFTFTSAEQANAFRPVAEKYGCRFFEIHHPGDFVLV